MLHINNKKILIALFRTVLYQSTEQEQFMVNFKLSRLTGCDIVLAGLIRYNDSKLCSNSLPYALLHEVLK